MRRQSWEVSQGPLTQLDSSPSLAGSREEVRDVLAIVQLIWLRQKGLVKIVVRGVVGVGRMDYFCPTLVHGELSRSSSAEREMPRKCGWWRRSASRSRLQTASSPGHLSWSLSCLFFFSKHARVSHLLYTHILPPVPCQVAGRPRQLQK